MGFPQSSTANPGKSQDNLEKIRHNLRIEDQMPEMMREKTNIEKKAEKVRKKINKAKPRKELKRERCRIGF